VPGSEPAYYLVALDSEGGERTDDPEGSLSRLAVAALAEEPVTAVFLFAHGRLGDVPDAVDQYCGRGSTSARP
jgi:hypothetical protein